MVKEGQSVMLKTKNIIYIFACVSIAVLTAFFLCSSADKLYKKTSAKVAPSQMNIIIDPGHGGEDGGASSKYSEALEKDINLQISKNLNALLKLAGYKTIMTREDDYSINDVEKTVRKRKVSDIHNRLKLTQKNKNSLLISIHQNKFSDSKYCGAQVFYSKNNEESKALAENIQNNMKIALDPSNNRTIKQAGKSVYLLNNCTCPAVLIECGFLSNEEEAKKLNDKEYQQNVAFSIFSAIAINLAQAEQKDVNFIVDKKT